MVSLDFSVTNSFRPYLGHGVDSATSENEYQEHFLGVKAAGAWGWQPHHIHVPNVMEICGPKPPGTLWATPGLLRDCFTFAFLCLRNDRSTKSLTESRISLNCRTSGEREEMCGLFYDGIDKFWMFAKLYINLPKMCHGGPHIGGVNFPWVAPTLILGYYLKTDSRPSLHVLTI
jgi:hypothetical protein